MEFKFLSQIIACFLGLLQAAKPIEDRLSRVRQVSQQAAQFNGFFNMAYVKSQRTYQVLLVLLAVVALCSFIGGVAQVLDIELPLSGLLFWLYDYTLLVFLAWFAVALVAATDLFSRFWVWATQPAIYARQRRWLTKVLTADFEASRNYLVEFVQRHREAQPVIINDEYVSEVADLVARQIEEAGDFERNRAKPAFELDVHDRANVALFGCILERLHSSAGEGWPRRDWGPFYSALNAAAGGDQVFSRASLRDIPAAELYDRVRPVLNRHLMELSQAELPQSITAAGSFREAAKLLIDRYGGSAYHLAVIGSSCGRDRYDIAIADERAREFPRLDGAGMRPQFLKLAVVWQVWPGIDPRSFIYPFSRQLAVYLLNKRVLTVPDDVKVLGFDEDTQMRSFHIAMRKISEFVFHEIENGRSELLRRLRERLPVGPGHERAFWVSYEVDFALWSIARLASADSQDKPWALVGGQVRRN